MRNFAAILRRRRTTVRAWGGVNIAVLTLVEDGLEEASPFYSFSSSAAGTLRWDFHSSATPPAAGAGDIATGTQAIGSGITVWDTDLSAYAGETGYLHYRVTNGAGTSNILTSQVITVPSANVPWSTSNKSANITLSGSNLIATGTGGAGFNAVLSDTGYSTGKKYFELKVVAYDGSNNNFFTLGLATTNASYTNNPGTWASGVGFQQNGTKHRNGFTSGGFSAGTLAFVDDVFGFAIDFDAGKLWHTRNGAAWPGSGDPATGANPFETFTSGPTFYAACALYQNNPSNSVQLLTANLLVYSPPSGFTSW